MKYKLTLLQIIITQIIWSGNVWEECEAVVAQFHSLILSDRSDETLRKFDSEYTKLKHYIRFETLFNVNNLLFSKQYQSIQKKLILDIISYHTKQYKAYSNYHYFILQLFDLGRLNLKQIAFLILIIEWTTDHDHWLPSRQSIIHCICEIYNRFLGSKPKLITSDIQIDADKHCVVYDQPICTYLSDICSLLKTHDIDSPNVEDKLQAIIERQNEIHSLNKMPRPATQVTLECLIDLSIADNDANSHQEFLQDIANIFEYLNNPHPRKYRYFQRYRHKIISPVFIKKYRSFDLLRKLLIVPEIIKTNGKICGNHPYIEYVACLIIAHIYINNIDFNWYRLYGHKIYTNQEFAKLMHAALLYAVTNRLKTNIKEILENLNIIFMTDVKLQDPSSLSAKSIDPTLMANIKVLAVQAQLEQSTQETLQKLKNQAEDTKKTYEERELIRIEMSRIKEGQKERRKPDRIAYEAKIEAYEAKIEAYEAKIEADRIAYEAKIEAHEAKIKADRMVIILYSISFFILLLIVYTPINI